MKLDKKYIILTVIYILTILVVIYATFLYKKADVFHYDDKIGMFIIDVSDYNKLYENIENYAYENDNFVIYYADNIDESLKKVIIEYDLSNELLYIDNFNVVKKIINDFSDEKKSIKKEKCFIHFSHGKIIDITSGTSMDYDAYKNYFSKVGLM